MDNEYPQWFVIVMLSNLSAPLTLNVILLSSLGTIILENITLRADALRWLGLPLQLADTAVRRIKLVIPYRALDDRPTIIAIEGVSCILFSDISSPSLDHVNLSDECKASAQSQKREVQPANGTEEPGLLKRMVQSAIRNLRISLHNINFEYHCKDSATGRDYKFGAFISSFEYTPTDSTGMISLTEVLDCKLGSFVILIRNLRFLEY